MAYGVIRTDGMSGTDVRADVVSVRYMGADGSTPTDIENGSVVKLGAFMTGERELRIGTAVKANDPIESVVVIATPELMYDERKKNLDEFINEAGTNSRGYRLRYGNTFGVTKEALTGVAKPAVGNIVELAAGTKLNVVASSTASSTKIGEIMAIETSGRYTYYVIEVKR